jgi:hypothetical protein
MPNDEPGGAPEGRSAWTWLVTASACIVLGVAAAGLAWWALSSERRVTSYQVRGALTAVTLDLGGSDAEIVGGRDEPVVGVRRTERFAFGQEAAVAREIASGRLRIRSRCPASVLGTCSATYRLTIPNNVAISVRTGGGSVRLRGFRGSAQIDTSTGDIAADAYCGFLLRARADTGDVSASTSCATERLELRSRTGHVRAVVPPGRYRIDADSDEGSRRVRGLVAAESAPFQIQALSSTGDVDLSAGP